MGGEMEAEDKAPTFTDDVTGGGKGYVWRDKDGGDGKHMQDKENDRIELYDYGQSNADSLKASMQLQRIMY